MYIIVVLKYVKKKAFVLNVYDFALQVLDRLVGAKKTAEHVEKEMRLHPVQCLLCGVYFHLPHLSNKVALCLGLVQHFLCSRMNNLIQLKQKIILRDYQFTIALSIFFQLSVCFFVLFVGNKHPIYILFMRIFA